MKGPRSGLVGVGAIIMLLAIVMDPFAQQIVAYPTRKVDVGVASVGRAQSYDTIQGQEGLYNGMLSLNRGLMTGPEFAMKSAVYNGIFTPEGARSLDPICPSGNCTFPLFDSLAVCGECKDVSKDVVNNDVGNLKEMIDKSLGSFSGDFNVSYTLLGNAVVQFSVFISGNDLAAGPLMVATTALPANISKLLFNLQDPFFTLAVLQFPNVSSVITEGSYFTSPPFTNVCSVYFCVNTYNVTVTNTVPNTTIVSSWTSDTGTPIIGGEDDSGEGYNLIETPDAVLERPANGIAGNHTYWIPAGTLAMLKTWMNHTFQGSLNTTGGEVDNSNGPVWVNDVMEALNVTSDWPALFSGLTTSMTTYIRSSGLKNSVRNLTGVSYVVESYVQVKWAWIAMPASLIGLSFTFLVSTIVINARKKALIWKSKSLPLLFHGLEGTPPSVGDRLHHMDEVASRMKVRLARGGGGEWKLVGT